MKKLLLLIVLVALSFTGCSVATSNSNIKPDYETVSQNPTPQTKYKKLSKNETLNFKATGFASYYGYKWHGRTTANGEKLNIYAMTAAHKFLPFGTLVKVTDLDTGRSIVVRINDRGPYIAGRVIDLTDSAAKKLGIVHKGVAKVKIEVIG